MRRLLSAAAAAALLASPALAKDPAKQTAQAIRGSQGRYGSAGCGLGSMAFGNQEGAVQILAATTNGLFGTQTFGITSGTSNCVGISGEAGARVFIDANREALAKDISRGSGETIGTLAWIAGCNDSKAVGATLQKSFGAIFPSATASTDDVTRAVLDTLRSDKSLACTEIG